MQITPKQRAGIRSKMRQIWAWYNPDRKQAIVNARRMFQYGRWWHECDQCLCLFPLKEINVDHIEEVGPAPGSRNAPPELTWPQFFERMWAPLSNLRVVCRPCHKSKKRRT